MKTLMHHGRCRPVRSGLTLVELLLVLAVLVAVAGMSMPALNSVFRTQALKGNVEAVRQLMARGRVEAIDAAIVYQFRYESTGHQFILIPFERDEVSAAGDAVAAQRVFSGEMEEGVAFRVPQGQTGGAERLDQEWFGGLPDASTLSQVAWSLPLLFFPDGTATDGAVEIGDERGEHISIKLRGLTGSVTVSSIQSDGASR